MCSGRSWKLGSTVDSAVGVAGEAVTVGATVTVTVGSAVADGKMVAVAGGTGEAVGDAGVGATGAKRLQARVNITTRGKNRCM